MQVTKIFPPSPSPGLSLKTENFDAMFASLRKPPIIVNDLDRRYPEDIELLDRYLLTNYDTATFSMIPQCECGKLVGGYLRGKVCKECDSEVLVHTEVPIESNLWLKVPDEVDAFISPIAYLKLSDAFTVNKIDIIRWMCDIHYKGDFNSNPVIVKLKERGVQRGYNNFIRNFHHYIKILLSPGIYITSSDRRKEIQSWIDEHQDNLFSQYLPLPNRIALVTEKTSTGRYGEITKFGGSIEAAMTMASLKTRIDPPNLAIRESTTIKCVMLLAAFYKEQYKNSIGRKEGWVRKHICGTRMPFTARNVIVSIHEKHDYDELHVPWAMAIGLLRIHLLNKFLRDGYSPNEAFTILHGHVNRNHPVIRRYLDELIAESPYKGIPCCFNRNPTLLRLSMQQLYITKIHDDINNDTIGLSVLVLKGYNAEREF
nr:MAG TPA: RNA polymerase I subunit [Caudoviricetes sp.]